MREGLAQWCGVEIAGELAGEAVRSDAWRRMVKLYLGQADLRRTSDGSVFANEPTLRDAGYWDDPLVPYVRGALVWRRLAHGVGRDRFLAKLRGFLSRDLARTWDWRLALEDRELAPAVRYFAATTRLPDLALVYDGARRVAISVVDPPVAGRDGGRDHDPRRRNAPAPRGGRENRRRAHARRAG